MLPVGSALLALHMTCRVCAGVAAWLGVTMFTAARAVANTPRGIHRLGPSSARERRELNHPQGVPKAFNTINSDAISAFCDVI